MRPSGRARAQGSSNRRPDSAAAALDDLGRGLLGGLRVGLGVLGHERDREAAVARGRVQLRGGQVGRLRARAAVVGQTAGQRNEHAELQLADVPAPAAPVIVVSAAGRDAADCEHTDGEQ
jgi:hypothetical protein